MRIQRLSADRMSIAIILIYNDCRYTSEVIKIRGSINSNDGNKS
jgi:hypothetical protein